MDGLFREEVMQAQRSQFLGTIRLATPISHQVWGLVAAAVTLSIVLWLCLGQYTRRERVTGALVPQAGLLNISARAAGTVTKVDVNVGASVVAGDPLLTISGDRSSAAMGDTDAAVDKELRTQETQTREILAGLEPKATAQAVDLRTRIDMLRTQESQIDAQLHQQREQAATLAQLVENLEPLHHRGEVSTVEFDQYQGNALSHQVQVKELERQRLDTEQQRSTLQAQWTQLPLDTAEKAHQLRGQLAQLQGQLAQSELERDSVSRAPYAGVVSSLLIKAGQDVNASQPLLTILPQGSRLQVQLLVPSSAIGFVHVGTSVVLHYQAFPYQKFGVQHGTVTQVSRNALTPSEITILLGQQSPPEPLYRVQVNLAKQTIDAYDKQQALLPGMTVNADLLLDHRRLIQWIFEPLYGMAQRRGGHN